MGEFPRGRNSESEQRDIHKEALVMASEISGLDPLHGYLKYGNLVVRMRFPYLELANRQERFIERRAAQMQAEMPPAAPSPDPAPVGNRSRNPNAQSRTCKRAGAVFPVAIMVTISKPISASQAQAYHRDEFQNARENYYTEGDKIRGEWHGRLAAKWGLRGEVNEEHFARLAEGQHPETGEQLVRHQTPREYVERCGRNGEGDGAPGRMGCHVQRTQERESHGAGWP